MDTLQKKILCPSILNLSTDNMREEIEKLDATDMDIYHVDIMDGTFVPNFGMSVRELEMIRRITDAGHHKLVDCHMMVMNPHRYIKRIAEAGADIIYIHPESELIPSATLELIQLALGHKHLDTTVKYLGILDNQLMTASREFYEKHSDLYGIKDLL